MAKSYRVALELLAVFPRPHVGLLASKLGGKASTNLGAREWKSFGDYAALSSPSETLLSKTAALTTATRCAPLGDHLMRCFFPMRTLAISFTRPSALDVETALPC